MFYSIENFLFLTPFVENVDIISNEFHSAKGKSLIFDTFLMSDTHFALPHVYYWAIETMGKDGYYKEDERREKGIWGGFPLLKSGFEIDDYNVYQLFPKTMELLNNVEKIFFSSLMRLTPNGLISTHQHKMPNLIFHLCLFDNPGGSLMTCGNYQKKIEKRGDYALFDYRIPHSTINQGCNDRINLVIDFNPMTHKNLIPDLTTQKIILD